MKRYHYICDMTYDTFPSNRYVQRLKLKQFLQELVKTIHMSILSGPHFAYGSDKKGAQLGWSATCIIDFSSITIHQFEQSKEIKLDVFSCKSFDYHKVKALALKSFGGKVINEMMLVI